MPRNIRARKGGAPGLDGGDEVAVPTVCERLDHDRRTIWEAAERFEKIDTAIRGAVGSAAGASGDSISIETLVPRIFLFLSLSDVPEVYFRIWVDPGY